jgi:UDP-N-acetylglucosamine transferase subunit ALG13
MRPFDRLINALDTSVQKGLIDDELFAQIGDACYKPRFIRHVDVLDRETYIRQFKVAKAIISHAGMGTIAMADRYEKPLLVLPRLKKYGENVSDHQLQTARVLANESHFLLAKDTNDLIKKIRDLKTFTPKKRITDADAVVERIAHFLREIHTG